MRRGLVLALALILAAMPVWSATKPKPKPKRVLPALSVYSIEASTGLELFSQNADTVRPPASMIKLALMLLVSEGVEAGRWSLETPVTATRHAEKMGGTQVYVKMGETYPLGHLMFGVAVASANDAAMAVAEGLWGSEEVYLDAANARIQQLGMTNSVFRSVHGLPPSRGEQPDETTAKDMATLARECVKHKQIMEWAGTKKFRFRPEEAEHLSTNKLMQQMPECDGLKTGYIAAAGFCVTSTAQRGDVRIITVIMGHPDNQQRFRLAKEILNEGLDSVRKGCVIAKDSAEKPKIVIENGKAESVPVNIADEIWATTRGEDWDRIKIVWDVPQKLAAPVAAGKEVGEVRAELDGHVLGRSKLVLGGGVEESTWVWRTEKTIRSYLNSN